MTDSTKNEPKPFDISQFLEGDELARFNEMKDDPKFDQFSRDVALITKVQRAEAEHAKKMEEESNLEPKKSMFDFPW